MIQSIHSSVQVVRDLGTADVDARLEELLIDGILYAFQEQVTSSLTCNGLCVPPVCKTMCRCMPSRSRCARGF